MKIYLEPQNSYLQTGEVKPNGNPQQDGDRWRHTTSPIIKWKEVLARGRVKTGEDLRSCFRSSVVSDFIFRMLTEEEGSLPLPPRCLPGCLCLTSALHTATQRSQLYNAALFPKKPFLSFFLNHSF